MPKLGLLRSRRLYGFRPGSGEKPLLGFLGQFGELFGRHGRVGDGNLRYDRVDYFAFEELFVYLAALLFVFEDAFGVVRCV